MAKKEAIIFRMIQISFSQKKPQKKSQKRVVWNEFLTEQDFWTFSFPVEVTGTLSPYPIVVKVTKPHQSASANVSKWAGFSSCSTCIGFVKPFYPAL